MFVSDDSNPQPAEFKNEPLVENGIYYVVNYPADCPSDVDKTCLPIVAKNRK